jgi:hypothetical protein
MATDVPPLSAAHSWRVFVEIQGKTAKTEATRAFNLSRALSVFTTRGRFGTVQNREAVARP